MTALGERTAARLVRGLIEICDHGADGFRAAARGVDDPPLRRLLESYADQRTAFARELRRELLRLVPAGAPELSPPPDRPSHDVERGTGSAAVAAIIADCARRELGAIQAYDAASVGGAVGPAQAVVERQQLQVREAHDHLRSLEEACAATP